MPVMREVPLVCEGAAEFLKARPVVHIEAFADLRTDVREQKGLIHGPLTVFQVRCGYEMPSVESAAAVVRQFGTKVRWFA